MDETIMEEGDELLMFPRDNITARVQDLVVLAATLDQTTTAESAEILTGAMKIIIHALVKEVNPPIMKVPPRETMN